MSLLISTELVAILQLIASWLFLFVFAYKYGRPGIYTYIVTAVILSNIQVLKLGQFFWSHEPVALGTVVFASTFLATDILTEFHSEKAAKKSVTLGFLGFAFFSVLMLLHVYSPQVSNDVLSTYNLTDGHTAMEALFTPSLLLLISSLISYFASERLDIFLYVALKRATKGKALWLRSVLAASLSAFVDTAIFSILAWKVFEVQSISWSVLFSTYIFGSFWPRVMISITGIPILYALRYLHTKPLPPLTESV